MKYQDTDIYENPELMTKAEDELQSYTGLNAFVLDVKYQYQQRGAISVAQARGILNVFEAEAERKYQQETLGPVAEAYIRDGKYTVIFEDESYITLRLNTPDHGNFKDKQIASYLNGPDNNYNYKGFAFVNGTDVAIWRAFQPTTSIPKQKLALVMLLHDNDPGMFGYNYALQSSKCYICGRTLTVPASLHRGMGPICAANTGETD